VKSYRSRQFHKLYAQLPTPVQEQAKAAYQIFKANPYHPSLHFKQIRPNAPVYSVRVGKGYRAVGVRKDDSILWYWIGSHADCDKLDYKITAWGNGSHLVKVMEQIKCILQNHFSSTTWEIARSKDGQQKAGYYAHNRSMEVFVKFTDAVAALQRLGEIAVAPRVLASGIDQGRMYVVQEYIRGKYPDWQWIATHLPLLASCIQRYHNDQPLIDLLSQSTTTRYHEHIALDLAQLEAQFSALNTEELHAPEITTAFGQLRSQAQRLQPVRLVPVHIDPNTRNMLLTDETLLLVDWDGILLSDPMRDAGLILWWYVSPRRWPGFFQSYGSALDDAMVERIFWWAARTSFAVALWHAEHQHKCTAFLQDFLAALARKGNPHAIFSK
jgi:thiamine kinase-like enzyme